MIDVLQTGVLIFIYANEPQLALERVQLIEMFLRKRRPSLPRSFFDLQAMVLSLNGDLSQWHVQQESKAPQRDKKKQRRLRKRQELAKAYLTEQENKKASEASMNEEKERENRQALVERELPLPSYSYDIILPKSSGKKDLAMPKLKEKTRKPSIRGHETSRQDAPTLREVDPLHSQVSSVLNNKAYKTCRKLLEGQLKISRQRVYNLFRTLGCEVDERKGKGVHGKISFDSQAIIRKNQNILTVLPNFNNALPHFKSHTHKEKEKISQDIAVTMLTIPDWDHKWSGKIPPYLIKNILKALEQLGVNKDTIAN